jgi:hypothetical protein
VDDAIYDVQVNGVHADPRSSSARRCCGPGAAPGARAGAPVQACVDACSTRRA